MVLQGIMLSEMSQIEKDKKLYDLSYMKVKVAHCLQLFETPLTTQSMEFSRPEYWSG